MREDLHVICACSRLWFSLLTGIILKPGFWGLFGLLVQAAGSKLVAITIGIRGTLSDGILNSVSSYIAVHDPSLQEETSIQPILV